MCAISGIWNFDNRPVENDVISRLNDSMLHRGPDGRGIWRDDSHGISLGHRRLAILDLSDEGAQPMLYANGRYCLTYNGEIYNFLELKSRLLALGHSFKSDSDTEVILAAYAQWGADMLSEFNGMWAIAIYDRQKREMFLCRDRFGIKPLLYLHTEKKLCFASELKAFKCLQGYSPEIDRQSMHVFLNNGFGLESTERTLFKGIKKIPAGHYAVISKDSFKLTRWWKTLDKLPQIPTRFESQVDDFQSLFHDAVKMRMRSDVAVGSCLSGGFDSSAIVCTMAELGVQDSARQSQDWQKTFVATFPGCANDERAAAEEVIHYTGVEGNYLEITDTQALNNINRVLTDMDDVYVGLLSPIWNIYHYLRQNQVVVSLDGHGADELMGAYKSEDYLLMQSAPSWLSELSQNINIAGRLFDILKANNPDKGLISNSLSTAKMEILYHPSFEWIQKPLFAARDMIKPRIDRIEGKVFTSPGPRPEGDFLPLGYHDELPGQWSYLEKALYHQFHTFTLPSILRNFDRLSMAHGIEVRMPFMDWRLVTYIMALPIESKIGNGWTKRIAREAMKGRMPESIRSNKKKIGFNSPMPEWLGGPLKNWTYDLINDPAFKDHDMINISRLKMHIKKHSETNTWTWYNLGTVWQYLNALWFEKNFIRNM